MHPGVTLVNAYTGYTTGKDIYGEEMSKGAAGFEAVVGVVPLIRIEGAVVEKVVATSGSTFAEYKATYWAGKIKPVLDPIINRETGQVWKQYTELHHRFIPQRWKWAPDWLKNNKWNLQEVNSLEHSILDPYRARFAPKWAKDYYKLKGK